MCDVLASSALTVTLAPGGKVCPTLAPRRTPSSVPCLGAKELKPASRSGANGWCVKGGPPGCAASAAAGSQLLSATAMYPPPPPGPLAAQTRVKTCITRALILREGEMPAPIALCTAGC